MNTAYLLTGGNIGDRKKNLKAAANSIEKEAGHIVAISGMYETAAWGKTDQAAFLNQCIAVETILDAQNLLKILLSIEKEMGRHREVKYGPRTLDIDILLYNNDIINTDSLIIPHPQMINRRFALAPLAEIAPAIIHPVFKKSIQDLLLACKDALPVKKL